MQSLVQDDIDTDAVDTSVLQAQAEKCRLASCREMRRRLIEAGAIRPRSPHTLGDPSRFHPACGPVLKLDRRGKSLAEHSIRNPERARGLAIYGADRDTIALLAFRERATRLRKLGARQHAQ